MECIYGDNQNVLGTLDRYDGMNRDTDNLEYKEIVFSIRFYLEDKGHAKKCFVRRFIQQ